jgi:YidC/Oxa1 family membrane protein insertase
MAKQSADVNPQQQMMLRIMPLLFVVFAINVPLAVVIYWVTTNLWSMGQQWVLLRNAPRPATAGAPTPATASAAVPSDGGNQPRKGLAGLGLFRGQNQQEAAPAETKQSQGNAKNGKDRARSNAPAKGGGSSARNQKSGSGSGGGSKGGQARSPQAGRSGTGNGRKPGTGGRPSGKGKSGGQQRRSKR